MVHTELSVQLRYLRLVRQKAHGDLQGRAKLLRRLPRGTIWNLEVTFATPVVPLLAALRIWCIHRVSFASRLGPDSRDHGRTDVMSHGVRVFVFVNCNLILYSSAHGTRFDFGS